LNIEHSTLNVEEGEEEGEGRVRGYWGIMKRRLLLLIS
jgi:hypothetical protein